MEESCDIGPGEDGGRRKTNSPPRRLRFCVDGLARLRKCIELDSDQHGTRRMFVVHYVMEQMNELSLVNEINPMNVPHRFRKGFAFPKEERFVDAHPASQIFEMRVVSMQVVDVIVWVQHIHKSSATACRFHPEDMPRLSSSQDEMQAQLSRLGRLERLSSHLDAREGLHYQVDNGSATVDETGSSPWESRVLAVL